MSMAIGVTGTHLLCNISLNIGCRLCSVPAPTWYGAHHARSPAFSVMLCPEAAVSVGLQALPRCCNSCMVGCQRVTTGNVRPPQPYVSIRVGRQRKA